MRSTLSSNEVSFLDKAKAKSLYFNMLTMKLFLASTNAGARAGIR